MTDNDAAPIPAEYDDICLYPDCWEVGNYFWRDHRGLMASCFEHFSSLSDKPIKLADETVIEDSDKE